MSKLLLIDGSNYLFRAYHALPPLTTSRGEPSGAIKGFLGMLANVARLSKADRAAVIFDAPGKTSATRCIRHIRPTVRRCRRISERRLNRSRALSEPSAGRF